MHKLLSMLFGSVTVTVTGAEPEKVLNACQEEEILLWRMEPVDAYTLRLCLPAGQYRRFQSIAERCQCEGGTPVFRGIPFFLKRFRHRYALVGGLLAALIVAVIGSQTILVLDVTGNERVSKEEVMSSLRLCGLHTGSFGPSLSVRTLANRMMLAMDDLTFCAVNLYGTRAEIIVRDVPPGPSVADETTPTNVIAGASGIVTHIEPWSGDPCVKEGDTVLEGELLITGEMILDPPPNSYLPELGTMLVHGEGKVMARTWHTETAEIALSAQGKFYTGEEKKRHNLSILGVWVNFFGNSSISYPNYDTISQYKSWTPVPGKTLPIVWETQTIREYTPKTVQLDRTAAETILKSALLSRLRASMEDGEILKTEFTLSEEGDRLSMTLLAECQEQIGRVQNIDTDQKVTGPTHPGPDAPTADQEVTEEKE